MDEEFFRNFLIHRGKVYFLCDTINKYGSIDTKAGDPVRFLEQERAYARNLYTVIDQKVMSFGGHRGVPEAQRSGPSQIVVY